MPPRHKPNPQYLRTMRLEKTVRAAAWWILALGAMNMLVGDNLSIWLHWRYHITNVPLIRSLGLSYLMLGLLLRRMISEPEQQYLLVDLLTLFFASQVLLFSTCLVEHQDLTRSEYVMAAVNLGFSACLMLWRTKGSRMAEGAPGAKDARQASRETIQRLKELLEEKKRRAPLPPKYVDALGAPTEAQSPPKRVSEAAPHMD